MSHLGLFEERILHFTKMFKLTRRYGGNSYMKISEHMLIVIT